MRNVKLWFKLQIWWKIKFHLRSVICRCVLRYELLDLETVKQYVLKYYADGVTAIDGRGKEEGNIIAYAWRFYNSEYEKRRNGI